MTKHSCQESTNEIYRDTTRERIVKAVEQAKKFLSEKDLIGARISARDAHLAALAAELAGLEFRFLRLCQRWGLVDLDDAAAHLGLEGNTILELAGCSDADLERIVAALPYSLLALRLDDKAIRKALEARTDNDCYLRTTAEMLSSLLSTIPSEPRKRGEA